MKVLWISLSPWLQAWQWSVQIAGRYGKQLASHLGHKITSAWDDGTLRGLLTFPSGVAEMTADSAALVIRVSALAEEIDSIEGAIGRHLVKFGKRNDLVVRWIRSDGSAGTTQGVPEVPTVPA